MVCVLSLRSFRWSLGCPWVVSNDVCALQGGLKKSSGGVLKVSGNCRKVSGAFSDADMESLIHVYFFQWSLRALGPLGRLKRCLWWSQRRFLWVSISPWEVSKGSWGVFGGILGGLCGLLGPLGSLLRPLGGVLGGLRLA